MRLRLSILLVVLGAGATISLGPATSAAFACGSYWNIPVGNACQYYTPSEAHAESTFGGLQETSLATHELDALQHYLTQANGSWIGAQTVPYNTPAFWSEDFLSDKVGCRNHHTVTVFVNCHHHDGWS